MAPGVGYPGMSKHPLANAGPPAPPALWAGSPAYPIFVTPQASKELFGGSRAGKSLSTREPDAWILNVVPY